MNYANNFFTILIYLTTIVYLFDAPVLRAISILEQQQQLLSRIGISAPFHQTCPRQKLELNAA